MKDIGAILFLLAAGPGFLWLGIQSLRKGAWKESIPLLEAVIDRALGVNPPPRNRWDQRFAFFQAWMFVLIGGFFSLVLAAIIFSFASE